MPHVWANGINVHYTAEGNGPPLVMLHGASSSALEDWSAQRPLFRRVFRLYLVDLRGHAGTRGPIGPALSTADLADDLLATVDALGLSTFHLAGFSLGGLTALQFAVRHVDRLRTLVLVGVDPQREPRGSVARVLMDPDRIEREEPGWAAQLERRHEPVQGPGAWRNIMRAVHAGIASETPVTPAELRRLRVPTLLVVGDRDVFVPVDHAVAFFRQLPDAQLCIVPDCGHQAMVLRPGLFRDVAEHFYRATEAVASERAMAGQRGGAAAAGPRRAPMPGTMGLGARALSPDAGAPEGGPWVPSASPDAVLPAGQSSIAPQPGQPSARPAPSPSPDPDHPSDPYPHPATPGGPR